MGGNTFTNLECRKLTKQSHTQYSNQLLLILKQFYNRAEMSLSLPDKEIFGDIDILVAEPVTSRDEIRKKLAAILASKETKFNGNTDYYEWNSIQIDIVNLTPETFDDTKFYRNWGDFSNIAGMIARHAGFSYKPTGLFLLVKDELGKKIDELLLTTDLIESLRFLGFSNPERLSRSDAFSDSSQLFFYLTESRFFQRRTFNSERFNCKNKTRFQKRRLFQRFVKFVGTFSSPDNMLKGVSTEALTMFDKKSEYDNILRLHHLSLQRAAKRRQLIKRIRETFTLSDMELGSVMKTLNEKCDWVVIPIDTILEQVLEIVNGLKRY